MIEMIIPFFQAKASDLFKNFSQYQRLDEFQQLIEILTGTYFITAGLISAHLAVARVPEVPGFRVQPDHPATSFPHIIQYLLFRIAVIRAAVTDNDQGGLLVENVQVIFFKLAKGKPVIGGRVVFDIRLFQDLVNGLVDITVLKNAGHFIQSGHEDKTTHLGKAILQRIEHVQHKSGSRPDRTGNIAQGYDFGFAQWSVAKKSSTGIP